MCQLTEANAPNIIRFFGYNIESTFNEDAYLSYHFNIIMEYASKRYIHKRRH